MANYVADVQVLDAESQRRVPEVPPGTRVIIVTCMDCRIDVWSTFRLQPSQAHVLRNAGGRPYILASSRDLNPLTTLHSQDALRSILLSLHIVEPFSNEIWVVHHTECGMMLQVPDKDKANEAIRDRLFRTDALKPHKKDIEERINQINFLPITSQTLEESVRADVQWLRDQQPLIPANTVLRGFVYHVPRAPRLDIVQIPDAERSKPEPMWE